MIPAPPRILTVGNKKDESFLRAPAKPFSFPDWKKGDIRTLIRSMRAAMHRTNGVGLSANQVGVNARIFIAQVENKFYVVFNPELKPMAADRIEMEEGCLSVPKRYGIVPRAPKVILTGFDQNGRRLKIKAHGLLAQIFQHEIDHLNGGLFTDRALRLFTPEPET